MKEGGVYHRLTISRRDVRYFAKHRRWVALVRSLWITLVLRNYGERCQICGHAMDLIWWSPTPLWCELVSTSGGGCLCTRCYNTPMVAGRYDAERTLTPTTNWWLSDTRDWLMMGEPDPACFDRDRDSEFYPTQWPWERVKNALADVIPPSSNSWGRPEAPPVSLEQGFTAE